MIFSNYGISTTEVQNLDFERLFALFSGWNSKMNLSAIRDREGVFEKHFADSLLPTKFLDFGSKKILDLGSGGGFPVLPLAIFNRDSAFFALDSVGKKMHAVQEMADSLKLPVKTVHGRIEEFAKNKDFRAQFDLVTARALAPWPVLLGYALPFVKVGGVFLAYQGPKIREDLIIFKDLEKTFGGVIEKIFEEKLGDADRVFVQIKKVGLAPKNFSKSGDKVG